MGEDLPSSRNVTEQSLFNRIDDRVARDREEGDYAYFHALILKLEYLTKIVVSGVIACVGDDADRHRYSLEHKLVRANSIGEWAFGAADARPYQRCDFGVGGVDACHLRLGANDKSRDDPRTRGHVRDLLEKGRGCNFA